MGYQGSLMVFHAFWLVSMVFQGSFMVFHAFWLVSMVFHGSRLVYHGSRLVFHGFSPECTRPKLGPSQYKMCYATLKAHIFTHKIC